LDFGDEGVEESTEGKGGEREEKRGLRSRETETVREPSVRLTSEAVTKWGAFLLTESEVRHVREREKKEMRSDSW
jgi:hypothetical protein